MTTLKSCPFCGGKARLVTRDDEDIWSHETVAWGYVLCESCDVQTSDWPIHHKNPTEAWNRRATDENAAYERAAMVCEESPDRFDGNASALTAKHCAAAIMALKKMTRLAQQQKR